MALYNNMKHLMEQVVQKSSIQDVLDHHFDHYKVKTSGALIKKILEHYGETRKYAAEGGRTIRGTRTAAEKFVAKPNAEFSELQELDDAQKHLIID